MKCPQCGALMIIHLSETMAMCSKGCGTWTVYKKEQKDK